MAAFQGQYSTPVVMELMQSEEALRKRIRGNFQNLIKRRRTTLENLQAQMENATPAQCYQIYAATEGFSLARSSGKEDFNFLLQRIMREVIGEMSQKSNLYYTAPDNLRARQT